MINLSDMPVPPTGAHAWDDESLSTVERRLVRFVGPMARILVRQAAAHAHDARELYGLLAVHIADARERARFEAHAQAPESSGSHGARPSAANRVPTSARAAGTQPSSRVRTPRPLEQAFIEHTTSRLAVYLGPIARVVAKKAAQQAHDTDEFVQLGAEHIGTQDRNAFLREVGELGSER